MGLAYRKFTEEEDKMRNLIEDGEYEGYIEAIEHTQSKGGLDKDGNQKIIYPMAVLDLIIIDRFGRDRKLKDWVLLDGDMAWKFRHLANACNLLQAYEDDTLELKHLVSRRPIVKLGIKEMYDQNKQKVKRNTVFDYLLPALSKQTNGYNFIDDEIPNLS